MSMNGDAQQLEMKHKQTSRLTTFTKPTKDKTQPNYIDKPSLPISIINKLKIHQKRRGFRFPSPFKGH